MNYPLRDAILAYLNGGTAEHFAETMETLRENYPRDVFYNLMNIIGTHDTARALTVLGVMSEDWKKSRDKRAHYELPPDRLETATATRSTGNSTRGARRTERSSHSTAVCARSAQTAKH